MQHFFDCLIRLDELNNQKNAAILNEGVGLTDKKLKEILSLKIRTEKIAIKDVKLRTFITAVIKVLSFTSLIAIFSVLIFRDKISLSFLSVNPTPSFRIAAFF